MSQLFTVYFPKYHFVLQKEFTITFPQPLPFSYNISKNNNVVYVDAVHFQNEEFGSNNYSEEQIQDWIRKGLQPGLRIIKINNKILIEEVDDKIGGSTQQSTQEYRTRATICPRDFHDLVINLDAEKSITFTFREEVVPIDTSVGLGLEWKLQDELEFKESVESGSNGNFSSQQLKSSEKNIISNRDLMKEIKISVSSYEEAHDPTQCRLNNPHNYWSPTVDDENSRDVWITFDLGMQRSVDRIHIQGSQSHKEYVKSIWIGYSNDGFQWESHPMRAIKCHYKANGKSNHASETATIKLWPVIYAQFIKIRPYEWHDRVAMRIELFGPKTPRTEFGRIVTLDQVHLREKNALIDIIRNKPVNTKAIQVDCKAVITAALDRAGCTYSVLDADQDSYLCVFTTPNADTSERAMDSLADAGVGNEMGEISALSIDYRNAPNTDLGLNAKKLKTKTGFYATVKSRFVVKQVVERIINSAAFTFDYFCMLTAASLIAAAGLATNSAVIVVASMLVSPIMGPALALTFGWTLKNSFMAKMGFYNELLSLAGCIFWGFVVGFSYAFFSSNRLEWPTQEMASRGNSYSLADGAFIAAASGIGVALSVLGDFIAAMVGVAISASLLPPAVNCGMLLSFVLYEMAYPQHVNDYDPDFKSIDTAKAALFSLLLTLENILIIILVSRLVFWIKDVYVTNDQNSNMWQSVFNFKTQYTKLKNMQKQGGVIRRTLSRRRSQFPSQRQSYGNVQMSNLNGRATIIEEESERTDSKNGGNYSDGTYDNFNVYSKIGTNADRAIENMKGAFYTKDLNPANNDTLKRTWLRQESIKFTAKHSEFRKRGKSRGGSTFSPSEKLKLANRAHISVDDVFLPEAETSSLKKTGRGSLIKSNSLKKQWNIIEQDEQEMDD